MKKLVFFLLIAVLVFTTAFSASAANSEDSVKNPVAARYTYLYSISAGLSITNRTATCTSDACTSQSGYTLTLTMTLYRGSTPIGSWVGSGPGLAGVSLYETVSNLLTGYTYQVKAVAKVYSGSTLLETATKYSSPVSI